MTPEPPALFSSQLSSAASRALQGILVFVVRLGVTVTSPMRKLLSLEWHKFKFYNYSYQPRNGIA